MTEDILTHEEHQRFIKSKIDEYNHEINQGKHIKNELKSYSIRQPDSCMFFNECAKDLFEYINKRNAYLRMEVERLKKMLDEEGEG